MKPNFNFHCIVLLQLLYLCAACEELYNTEMVPPEGAIVFDGVITNEPPPYFFSLSKPSGGLGEYVSRGYERINDAEIVIIDQTVGVRDTLKNAELTPYNDFRYYDHYRHKEVTVPIKWDKGETPGGLYVTTKIYGIENHIYELHIKYKGKEYTPKSFAESLGLNMDDYIELTSFTHHPYYVKFDVEVPDNWEHSLMYNLPLDEMMQTVDYALNNGYTVCWDGDVSEKGFSFTNGVAINPEVKKVEDLSNTDRARFEKLGEKERLEEVFKFERPYPEINVTPEVRQAGFESFVTTDDHLMHLTGIAKDQNGTKYYITKNSWGTDRNKFGGYLNMSESFVRAKTIYVMVHKDAIPKAIKGKLHL